METYFEALTPFRKKMKIQVLMCLLSLSAAVSKQPVVQSELAANLRTGWTLNTEKYEWLARCC